MRRSEKAERERARLELRSRGLTVAQIAEEMADRFHVRPRTAWRYALGWEQWKTVQEFRTANPAARIDDSRVSKWESWPYSGTRPSLENLAGLAHTFGHGCTVADLVDDEDLKQFSTAERQLIDAARMPVPDTYGDLAMRRALEDAFTPDLGPDVMRAAAVETAYETWQHLASAAVSIDPIGIQVMYDQISELSRAYPSTAPAVMLRQARRARDTTFRMLEQTKRPAQLVDLHLAAGMSCALLASASFDLGQSDAALAQTRAADRYADMAGHPGLRAWAAGFTGLIAYWDDRPAEAVQVIEAAISQAPAGRARARLGAIQARAWALMDNPQEVRSALAAADGALEAGPTDDLHDVVAGELGWTQLQHDMCAGTALVTVGDADDAVVRLASVVEQHDPSAPLTDFGRTRADLAVARLTTHDLDGAVDALAPVWATPVEQRRFALTSRLDKLGAALVVKKWKDHAPAVSLRDQISTFVAEADHHRALLAAGPSE